MSHKDITWNTEKAAQIVKELRQADQILVGLGGGFSAAAGVAPLPLDKKLSSEDYWQFCCPTLNSSA